MLDIEMKRLKYLLIEVQLIGLANFNASMSMEIIIKNRKCKIENIKFSIIANITTLSEL